MKPELTIFVEKGINMTFWHKNPISDKKKYRFMIFCYGLPSHPYQHSPAKLEEYIDEETILVYPHYIGTWASKGTMSWENCTKTILLTIDFIKKGKGRSAYDRAEYSWFSDDIVLVGGSFGSSVALVAAAKSPDIKSVIAVAGPINWRDHSKIPEELGEPIEDLYYSIDRGWKNLWRIPSKEEWKRLALGTADLNPIDYIDVLKDKNTLLIHGKNDLVVSCRRSEELHEKIKNGAGTHKLIILKDQGHLGNDIIGDVKLVTKVIHFLKNTS